MTQMKLTGRKFKTKIAIFLLNYGTAILKELLKLEGFIWLVN